MLAELIDNIEIMLKNAGFENISLIPKENSDEIISSWFPGKNLEKLVASYIIEAENQENDMAAVSIPVRLLLLW